jgi:hypothetical protein
VAIICLSRGLSQCHRARAVRDHAATRVFTGRSGHGARL